MVSPVGGRIVAVNARARKKVTDAGAPRNCSRCGELLPAESFYFISKKIGKRRGECKECMTEVKRAQCEPGWRPKCVACGVERERVGPGRRLCVSCFNDKCDDERPHTDDHHGYHPLLNPCKLCGARRLAADHVRCAKLCPLCRSVPQGRRKRLKEFNLTPPEYLALLDAHGHACAICKRKTGKTLHIDHKHSAPMIVRGLLCGRCNTLIAMARDGVEVLSEAAAYLTTPPAQAMFPGRTANESANSGFTPLVRAWTTRRAA